MVIGNGTAIKLDDKDHAKHIKFTWHLDGDSVARIEDGKKILLHRVLAKADKGTFVEFIDGNKQNLQRENLRVVGRPTVKESWGKSKYKGVSRSKDRWQASIRVNGVLEHLGRFDSAKEAARAYDAAAVKHLGRFAQTNRRLGLI